MGAARGGLSVWMSTSLRTVRIGAVALLLVGALVALVLLRDDSEPAGDAVAPSLTEPNEPAGPPTPEIPFELFDGTSATFADFRGTPLVVNFWASWCPACVVELPEFQAVHERLGDEVTFLGFANADDRERAIALAEDTGVTYTLADDPNGEMFVEFGLFAMPSTVFVTADGIVHDTFGGQLDAEALSERIDELRAASG